ncbi:hypothetical protein SAY87_029135 [Trapa incisa]|uniref:Uncharacterized protein n=1 Tax=Trapa incisa TaxID=236973 RepID=A0AAN7KW19_9MYRT|nr:hypothetical protein SAY87_029135 [Trapa incisa]
MPLDQCLESVLWLHGSGKGSKGEDDLDLLSMYGLFDSRSGKVKSNSNKKKLAVDRKIRQDFKLLSVFSRWQSSISLFDCLNHCVFWLFSSLTGLCAVVPRSLDLSLQIKQLTPLVL